MNKRVLIVDDEPDIILTLKIVLEENGFKVDHLLILYWHWRILENKQLVCMT
jgi:DNA-binding response OmpR family regulator